MAETKRRPPARTPQEEENYMIRISVDAAEQQILGGKASSQLLTHYLKLAAMREREKLEREKLEKEIELLKAKKEAIETAKEIILFSNPCCINIFNGMRQGDTMAQSFLELLVNKNQAGKESPNRQ